MKALVALCASVLMVGCGLDAEESFTQPATNVALVPIGGTPPATAQFESPLPTPVGASAWNLVWAREGVALWLVQVPVEERFFYIVVPAAAPKVPPPPCPSCR